MSTGRPELPPLVTKQTVREHGKSARDLWNAALRSFDPFPERLRALSDAADRQARVLRLAELANISWKPVEHGRDMTLSVGLEPGSERDGPPTLWAEFDERVHGLGLAAEGDQNAPVYTAFEALRDSARRIADALDPPVALDDRAQAG